jgi:hypothetical protein
MLKSIIIAAGIISLTACGGGSSGGSNSSGGFSTATSSPIESGLYYDSDARSVLMVDPISNQKVAIARLDNGRWIVSNSSLEVDNELELYEYNELNEEYLITRTTDNQITMSYDGSTVDVVSADYEVNYSLKPISQSFTSNKLESILESASVIAPSLSSRYCGNIIDPDDDVERPYCFTSEFSYSIADSSIRFVETFGRFDGVGDRELTCVISGNLTAVDEQFYISNGNSYVGGCNTDTEVSNASLNLAVVRLSSKEAAVVLAYYGNDSDDFHLVRWWIVET